MPHIGAARQLIELTEMFPAWAATAQGSIPETVNGIPDLLDEAAWGLDVFRRMQTDDGGFRGGIEGDRYRAWGAASWNEPTPLYAYAPDIYSSWEFAAAAAKMARALAPYDAAAAAEWLDSARRAQTWAESDMAAHIAEHGALDQPVLDARNLAALELYATTGEAAYHDLFLATFSHHTPADPPEWFEQQYEASFLYARLDPALTAAAARQALLNQADWLLANAQNSGFGDIYNPDAVYSQASAAPTPEDAARYLVRAHFLSGEARHLKAVQDDLHYGLDANPYNMAFLTGLDGIQTPQEILQADADALGRSPPPGIMLYGEAGYRFTAEVWYHPVMRPYLWPDFPGRPENETWQGYYGFVPASEFTVRRNISDTVCSDGYLAAINGDRAGPAVLRGDDEAALHRGGGAADRIEAQGGDDRILGRGGDDLLLGGDGRDRLAGGIGADRIWGGAGNDVIDGGTGTDHLFGGPGVDTFRYRRGNGVDTVHDFAPLTDRVRLLDGVAGGQTAAALVAAIGQFGQGGRHLGLDFGNGESVTLVADTDLRAVPLDWLVV